MKSASKTRSCEIRKRLSELARRHGKKEVLEECLLVWVIPGHLARVHRPLCHHRLYGGSRKPLPPEAKPLVCKWVERIRHEGVKSVISLMHNADLACYQRLEPGKGDLLDFLQSQGLEVVRLPWEDPHHSRTDQETKRRKLLEKRYEAWKAYKKLPKPVIIMCSAGIDRSAPVAAFLWHLE